MAQRVVAPQAGCTATPAQLEANKKVAMAFFASSADRVALADPSYKQHNPAFVKGGEEAEHERLRVVQEELRRSARGRAGARRAPVAAGGGGSAAAGRQPVRDRHRRVRSGDGHPQEQSSGSDGRRRHVLRGLHLRYVPRAERQARRALGRRGDQSTCGAVGGRGGRG